MNSMGLLFLVGFILVIGLLVFAISRSSRRDREAKQKVIRQLGFRPIEADTSLTEKIYGLYRRAGAPNRYELRNISGKVILDGEMYLFDLVETSGEDDSWIENQAVAIISAHLSLPRFTFFPKASEKFLLSSLANKVVMWGMSKIGTPVAFPEYPALNARYVVTADDTDAMRRFLDEPLAHYFAQTQMYMIHAAGDIFTFSEMNQNFKTGDLESMSRRIQHALDIFQQLLK